ncbi:hypothetical protein Mal4_09080 [Maioricimonas rarisocia]|uniref:Uncharacterized protein n=1 Tax=Maioricimonas rarisocia TaxID=2528026 RepID=A0A517Z2B7_9PLAN|nr:hypothetical protein [Maioricimonas rarisocia]QDU36621.1 hypothetical protein Mal4_09080 [Maioricimonas rarisocia]
MSNEPSESDLQKWHRYFAVEFNNRAWNLTSQERTKTDDREMLDCAHAAALHWDAAGTELNRMRAMLLLAEVHAQLGSGPSAQAYAGKVREYFANRDTDDWELATVYAVCAHAAYAARDNEGHRTAYAEAAAALERVADPDDRSVVQETFDQVPVP